MERQSPIPLFPSFLFPFSPISSLSFSSYSLPLRLRNRPLNSVGIALKAPLASVLHGAEPKPKSNLVNFALKSITSYGNNFNDFTENQLTDQILRCLGSKGKKMRHGKGRGYCHYDSYFDILRSCSHFVKTFSAISDIFMFLISQGNVLKTYS